jgi:DNA-directed RNA polymerase subunit RPC12/RpoP
MSPIRHVRLEVIPQPAEGARVVLVPEKGPIFMGENPGISYDCGTCGQALIEGVRAGQVGNVVIRCPSCGAFNEAPGVEGPSGKDIDLPVP